MGRNRGVVKSGAWFYRDMLLAKSYVSLPKCGILALNLFMLKRTIHKKTHECLNKNDITVTYKEMEALGMSRGSASNAIDALLERGFIKVIRRGGAYQQDKTIYGLADEWNFWVPGDEPIRIREKGIQAGYEALKNYHGRKGS